MTKKKIINTSTPPNPSPNIPGTTPLPVLPVNNGSQKGGFWGFIDNINERIMYLNNSKFFAGIIMIMLNIGSKFITIQFSKSTEEYLKYSVTKQLLVFAMAWMGTRDIYTAIMLTAAFVILSDHLFNEESSLCIVPHDFRVLHKLIDTSGDGTITDTEVAAAKALLEKAKKEKEKENQKKAMLKFDYYKM